MFRQSFYIRNAKVAIKIATNSRMSDEPQAVVKILDFIDGKWQIDPDKLPDGDGRPLAIITCIGDFGVGKSFLNNVLLNCLLLGVRML